MVQYRSYADRKMATDSKTTFQPQNHKNYLWTGVGRVASLVCPDCVSVSVFFEPDVRVRVVFISGEKAQAPITKNEALSFFETANCQLPTANCQLKTEN